MLTIRRQGRRSLNSCIADNDTIDAATGTDSGRNIRYFGFRQVRGDFEEQLWSVRVGGSRSDFVTRSRYSCQELLEERATLHSPAKHMF